MLWFANNWILIAFVVGMLAMHLFGHRGHGGHGGRSRHGGHNDGSDPQEAKKSAEAETVTGKVNHAGMTHDHAKLPADLKSPDGDHKPSDKS